VVPDDDQWDNNRTQLRFDILITKFECAILDNVTYSDDFERLIFHKMVQQNNYGMVLNTSLHLLQIYPPTQNPLGRLSMCRRWSKNLAPVVFDINCIIFVLKPADYIRLFVKLNWQISTKILSFGVKYYTRDLICDVIYCDWPTVDWPEKLRYWLSNVVDCSFPSLHQFGYKIDPQTDHPLAGNSCEFASVRYLFSCFWFSVTMLSFTLLFTHIAASSTATDDVTN